MKMTYTIVEGASLIRAKWHGVHDPIVVQARIRDVVDDSNLRQGLNYLSDQRGLETRPTSVSVEIGALYLEMLADKLGPFRYAILADYEDLYTSEQLAQLNGRAPQVEVRLFTDPVSAERWLDAAEEWR